MAKTVSVGSKSYIRPYRKVEVRHFPEKASQTFKIGDPLKITSEQVEVVGADPTALIVGVAAEDASGTTNNKVAVWLATPEAEFLGHVEDAQVLTAADVGKVYGIVADTTNLIWRVDRTETTAPCVMVLSFVDDVGDTNGRITFRFTNEIDTSNTQRRGPFTA